MMKKEYLTFTILLFIAFTNSKAQDIPNDTIFKKDGTKIIDNFKTITIYKDYLITSKYGTSYEKIKSINEKDLKKIAIPLREIDRIIDNDIYQKKRKLLNENDVVWESKTNNHKKKVWVYSRYELKSLVSPKGKLKFLKPLVEGKCDLYIEYIPYGTYEGFVGIDNYYYFLRKGEWKSTLFAGTGEFIRTKKLEYFNDCPKAREFIKTQKKISEFQVIELVKLYNEHCGKI